MLCILYANIVGALVGVAALLVERALPISWPRRWLWCLVIPFSMFIVGYYRVHHNWTVASALEQSKVATSGPVTQGSLSILNLEWWMHTSSYDRMIQRVWLTASALLIAWALANAWRVWRIVRLSRRQADPRRPALVDGIPVVVTDVVGPATVGIVRSNVLVPRWVLALPGAQRRYVLRHEEEHRKARDGVVLFLASLPLVLAPWNLAPWNRVPWNRVPPVQLLPVQRPPGPLLPVQRPPAREQPVRPAPARRAARAPRWAGSGATPKPAGRARAHRWPPRSRGSRPRSRRKPTRRC